VLAFAGYLDARRFCEAERCLAADCVYERTASQRILGAAAIIQSYRDNDASGAALLDDIHYTSRVAWEDSETVSVEFTDYLRCGEQSHTFVSRQHFTVRDGLIQRIVGEEAPAARQALEEFLATCGTQRRSRMYY
jgi:hypothetical protein